MINLNTIIVPPLIRNPNGEVIFEMKNVEVPAHWSQIATDILAQKYFSKAGVPQEDGSLLVAKHLSNKWLIVWLIVGSNGVKNMVILPQPQMHKYFMMS
jgi:hypothetical protein